MNEESVSLVEMEKGVIVRYGKSSFNHPDFPERALAFVQMRNGMAWIVDEAVANPGIISILGFDNVPAYLLIDDELNYIGDYGYWPAVSWACIRWGSSGEGSEVGNWSDEPYGNQPFRKPGLIQGLMDRNGKPPDHKKMIQRILKSRAEIRRIES